MDSISALLAFVRTAESGSIVGAARVLGLSASAVGKRIARLEQKLGTRLFQRTTRRVHLTDEGELLLQRCRPTGIWASLWTLPQADTEAELRAWFERMKARPAVARGLEIGKEVRKTNLATDKEAQKIMFGQRARQA